LLLQVNPIADASVVTPPKGIEQGTVRKVKCTGPNLLISLQGGDMLELKVSSFAALMQFLWCGLQTKWCRKKSTVDFCIIVFVLLVFLVSVLIFVLDISIVCCVAVGPGRKSAWNSARI
jgi:hypothetical protein